MAKENPMDEERPELQTLSGYYALSKGGMVPSQKMKRQEAEREEALAELKEHRKKAMETLSGLGVIVCDTNPEHRKKIVKTLQEKNFLVFTAMDEKEFQSILASVPIRAIIADRNFPGIEVIESAGDTMKIIIGDSNIIQNALSNVKKVDCPLEAIKALVEQG